MSSPPILPMSTPQPTPSAPLPSSSSSSSLPISTPALRRFLSSLSDALRRSLANRRPWSELLDRTSFSRPESLSDATSRLRKNLPYFRTNYLAFLLFVLGVSLLSHPFTLLTLLFILAAWSLYFFRPPDQPLVLLGRHFSDRETLSALVLLTVLVVFLTSVGSLLISALLAGAAVICVHGAFRVPEDLFLDDQDPGASATGLMSLLGGAAGAGPAVSVRVA